MALSLNCVPVIDFILNKEGKSEYRYLRMLISTKLEVFENFTTHDV